MNHCRKAEISHEAQGLAFDTILVGLAQDYYYESLQSITDINQLTDVIRTRFQTREQG